MKASTTSPAPAVQSRLNTALGLALAALLAAPVADAGKSSPKPPPALGSFTDPMATFDTTRWMKADGWINGAPFDNVWRADNINFVEGNMDIRLDDQGGLGEPYASGNYQTLGFYGYGCYEASFTPVAQSGVVSSLFTFAGPYDNGGNGRHNEIDIEFLGYDTTRFQTNFWTNDDSYTQGHEHIVQLGFDASQQAHRYGFKWTSGGIQWFVDGISVYQVANSSADLTPKAADSLHKIMMNVWPVDDTAEGWAGSFVYPGYALDARYDWVRYIQGADCSLAHAPDFPPPPPPGDPSTLHVGDINLVVNSRRTQAIAAVTVVTGDGQPVAGATVSGAWSGITTSGDAARDTGSDGVATFYSGRLRGAGQETFCVTNVAGTLAYAADSNVETCVSVSN